MGKKYQALNDTLTDFIQAQKIYFVGTAANEGSVNISPKGMDSFRVLSPGRVAWLNVTGSGNETAAHLIDNPRMTIMFCAFDGSPMILRLYGHARAIHRGDSDWQQMINLFAPLPGARQIFELSIDLVQTSCGMAVPYYTYDEDRALLKDWALKKGEPGIQEYWQTKNQISLDGKPTLIVEKSLRPAQ